MTPEGDKKTELVVLTDTQTQAAGAILRLVREAESGTLICLVGLSGVGKGTVLAAIKPRITALGAALTSRDKLYLLKSGWLDLVGKAVFSATPREIESFHESYQGIPLQTHILPGLTEPEIGKLVEALPLESRLSRQEVVQLSLGVPLLAQRLAVPGLTVPMAEKMVTGYLRRNFRPSIGYDPSPWHVPYFQIVIPDRLRGLLTNLESDHIYDDLDFVLGCQEELAGLGVSSFSPLFKAPESEGIYDQMLRHRGEVEIDIVVPGLLGESLRLLQESFGFDGSEYDSFQGTRSRTFPLDYRKVVVWHQDDQGGENRLEGFEIGGVEKGQDYAGKIRNGELPLQADANGGDCVLVVHAHDHPGLILNPTKVGWMVESLLQQLGLAYLVDNLIHRSAYYYDPKDNKIIFVKGP